MHNSKLINLTKGAAIAALYAVITLIIAPFGYGAIQVRLSEMLTNLAAFNKRYIWALTIGCVIANLWSPMGIIDIVFGSLSTLVATTLTYLIAKHYHRLVAKLAVAPIINTLMMWTIALELHITNHLPFLITYLTTALGEFISVTLGSVVFYFIAKRIDLSK